MMSKPKNDFKIWYDESNQVARVKFWGTINEKQARQYVRAAHEEYQKIRDVYGQKTVSAITDLTEAGKPSMAVRKIIAEGLRDLPIDRAAYFGGNQLARMIGTVINNISGIKDTKFFPREAEAISWIKEKQKDK